MSSSVIAIDDLKPGMVIVQITKQNGPVKIRKSGLVTSDAMVEGLSEMGVQELEIDPEQTVEIAPVAQHRTQTQALLRGQHDTSAKFDKSLNEQFNRSLFLPTVESLPSAWKLYSKQAATFAIVILGGLAIGFTSATTERWWPVVTGVTSNENGTTSVAQVANTPVTSTSADQGETTATQDAVIDTRSPESTPVNSTVNTAANSREPQTVPDDFSKPSQVADLPEANSAISSTPASNPNPINNSTVGQLPQDSAMREQVAGDLSREYEGRVLNDNQESSDVTVSPELMAKFNAAVKALDSQERDNSAEPDIQVTTRDDIPRVDQLPVRLLTRLPTMNFSAHMYASRPSDRWVRVNGRQMGEGEWIDDRVQIVNIEAQRVVLAFEDELFTMAALTDW